MRSFSKMLGCLALAAALFSCKKYDAILYNDVSFVNATAGVYISDAGLEYRIVQNETGKEIPAEGRMIFASDILKKVSDRVYNVRVNAFSIPLTKDPVPAGEAPAAEDPVAIETGWFSGGYFNILMGLYFQEGSETKHLVNVEYTLPTESNDTLYLHLLHDAQGEKPADPESDTGYSYVNSYACFRMAGLLPEGSEVPAKVTWKWFDELYERKLTLLF